jgi:hypothetical protein
MASDAGVKRFGAIGHDVDVVEVGQGYIGPSLRSRFCFAETQLVQDDGIWDGYVTDEHCCSVGSPVMQVSQL